MKQTVGLHNAHINDNMPLNTTNKAAYQQYKSSLLLPLCRKKCTTSSRNYHWLWWVLHIVTKSFWFFDTNHSKENTTTIICDILNHSQGKFVIDIKKISWSCPDKFFSKINIQIHSWSEKIARILQDIQSWSCPCTPLEHTLGWPYLRQIKSA